MAGLAPVVAGHGGFCAKWLSAAWTRPGYRATVRLMWETSRPLSLIQAGGLYAQLYELQARAYRKGRAGA
jgi:hypothetical protein